MEHSTSIQGGHGSGSTAEQSGMTNQAEVVEMGDTTRSAALPNPPATGSSGLIVPTEQAKSTDVGDALVTSVPTTGLKTSSDAPAVYTLEASTSSTAAKSDDPESRKRKIMSPNVPSLRALDTPAGPSTPTQSRPPYHYPYNVIYPKDSYPNPHHNSLVSKPELPNIVSTSLYRPAYLPKEIDDRIDKSAIWMGVDREMATPRYFVPASCKPCNDPSSNSHCDRRYPACRRCTNKGIQCVPGDTWRFLKFAQQEGRSAGESSKHAGQSSHAAASRPIKRPRLSEPAPGPSSTIAIPPKVEPRVEVAVPPSLKRTTTKKRAIPGIPTADPPLSADDRAYFARIEANDAKTMLHRMKDPCPVWAETRAGLTSALEYLRSPVKTAGASVEIGQGGIARGIILEGQCPSSDTYWGTGKRAGTIVTAIGKPRPVRKVSTQSGSAAPPAPTHRDEAPEIEALCRAHQARTPVAIAMAHDWSAMTFRLPRRFIVLGWFWVADAWVEPVRSSAETAETISSSTQAKDVVWRFRFEWCTSQTTPWWARQDEPDREPLPNPGDALTTRWPIVAPGLPKTRTLQPPSSPYLPPMTVPERRAFVCMKCSHQSRTVYGRGSMCLNEKCDAFAVPTVFDPSFRQSLYEPDYLDNLSGLTPDQLGLKIRPAVPRDAGSGPMLRHEAGREYWRAWVCDLCAMANERRGWSQSECFACGRVVQILKSFYSPVFLRNPSRPVCTGPRQDDGSPIWAFATVMSWTLFKDDIKVVRHGVDMPDGLGVGSQVQHALSTEGKGSHIAAGSILHRLQGNVELERRVQPHTTNRPPERFLSPFFTMAFGPEDPGIHHFPSARPIAWKKSTELALDTIDLINERAGRMWPGVKERFNSLLIAAITTDNTANIQPRAYIQPHEYFAFLFLGGDGEIRVKQLGRKGGEMKVQHGDVMGIKAGEEVLEVVMKFDALAFVGIARQVYRDDADVESLANEKPLGDVDFPSLPMPVSAPVPKALPRAPDQIERESKTIPADSHGDGHLTRDLRPSTVSAPTADTAPSIAVPRLPDMSISIQAEPNAAQAKKTPAAKLLDKAPLSGWYLGCRPLDFQDPFLSLPVLEDRAGIVLEVHGRSVAERPVESNKDGDGDVTMVNTQAGEEEPERKWTGKVQIQLSDLDDVTILHPPPVEAATKKALASAAATATTSTVSSVKGKVGKGKRKSLAAEEGDVESIASSPAPKAAKKAKGKGKGRASMAGGEVEVEEELEVIDVAPDPAGVEGAGVVGDAPKVKGKRKGRKSGGASVAASASASARSSPAMMAG